MCGAFLLGVFPLWAQEEAQDRNVTREEEATREDAGQKEKIKHDSSLPVDITSDFLEVDDKTGIFVFRGDVVAKQDSATIYSDQLDVYYTQKKETKDAAGTADTQSRSIEKIVARGSVKIVQEERIATGERAEYVYAEGAVILTGSPKVVQGNNTIAGEKITVYLDGKRSIVEGGVRERVQATFVPDDDGDK
ncbi:MAG: lipopolysaccharide transport periplasmic protein LptA [Desulfuromonadaceae bacterium]